MTVWTFIRIERLCARFLVAKPNMVAVLALAILAIRGTGLDRLEIKTGYRDLFHADDPLLLAIDAMHARSGSGAGLILMISARDGDVLDQSGLRAISALTRSLDALPQTRRVTSLSTQRRVTRTAIGTGIATQFARCARAAGLSPSATASSRSIITISAPLAAAFGTISAR